MVNEELARLHQRAQDLAARSVTYMTLDGEPVITPRLIAITEDEIDSLSPAQLYNLLKHRYRDAPTCAVDYVAVMMGAKSEDYRYVSRALTHLGIHPAPETVELMDRIGVEHE